MGSYSGGDRAYAAYQKPFMRLWLRLIGVEAFEIAACELDKLFVDGFELPAG